MVVCVAKEVVRSESFAGASTAHGHGEHWGYESHNGPNTWPDICQTGQRQSPIDINPAMVDFANIPKMHFVNYNRSGNVVLKNNGHSGRLMQAMFASESGKF